MLQALTLQAFFYTNYLLSFNTSPKPLQLKYKYSSLEEEIQFQFFMQHFLLTFHVLDVINLGLDL
jgi:hypothetical protein